MQLLILPISGGAFPLQLSMLCHILNANPNYDPEIILSASGGNVAAYITLAGGWNAAGIRRISKQIHSGFFIRRWSWLNMINSAIGYFAGTLFNYGEGLSDFFNNIFTRDKVISKEVWTAVYNRDLQKGQIFCNRSYNTSILPVDSIDFQAAQVLPPQYCDGDLDKISKLSLASASIPSLVPPQKIDNQNYVDGGIYASSPLTLLNGTILKTCRQNYNGICHMIYCNSINLYQNNFTPQKTILNSWKQIIIDWIRSQTIHDRYTAYNMLQNYGRPISYYNFDFNYKTAKHYFEFINKVQASLLEIFPIDEVSIDIGNFNGQTVVNNIDSGLLNLQARFWYITSDDDQIKIQKEFLSKF